MRAHFLDDTFVSMDDTNVSKAQEGDRWVLFVPQLPSKPDYLRVKLQRRIQKIGAVAIRNALYVLPASDESIEDFAWLRSELKADGGDALIFSATALVGMSDTQLEGLFRDENMTGKTWVTRAGVFVDRMASAWYIRRFIDSAAQFKFVSKAHYHPQKNEVRFDMFEGEFTHEGDLCTFEVLVKRYGHEHDHSLDAIAQIVHDLDLKDEKYNRAETAGVETILRGIASGETDDNARIDKAMPVFDGLHARFSAPV